MVHDITVRQLQKFPALACESQGSCKIFVNVRVRLELSGRPVLLRIRSAFEMASEMAHSRAGQGLLPISFSFRAARIVAAKRITYFRRSSVQSSSGNENLWAFRCLAGNTGTRSVAARTSQTGIRAASNQLVLEAVAELRCGPQRLWKFHHDAVVGLFRCSRRDVRKLSAEGAERHGGVGRARLRGNLGAVAHEQVA